VKLGCESPVVVVEDTVRALIVDTGCVIAVRRPHGMDVDI